MKMRIRRRIDALASARIDGLLDEPQRIRLQEMLTNNPAFQRSAEDLEATITTLQEMSPIEKDDSFWQRFQERLERQHRSSSRLFPALPRRHMQTLAVAGVLMLLVAMGLLYQQRGELARYVSRKSEKVQLAYQQTLGSPWLMPLFAKTDRDRVLRFAMYGTLALDDKRNAVLRINDNTRNSFRIELGSDTEATRPTISVEQLYREVRATPAQQRIMDTVFLFAQERLESAVLLGRERDVVIDPAITRLHTTILTTLASSLDPKQRVRLGRFLDANDAAYAISSPAPLPPPPPTELYDRVRFSASPKEFVLLRNESVDLVPMEINLDSIREHMSTAVRPVPSVAVRMEDYRKRYENELRANRDRSRATNITRLENLTRVYEQTALDYKQQSRQLEKQAELELRRVFASPDNEVLTILFEQAVVDAPAGDVRVFVRGRATHNGGAARTVGVRSPRVMRFRVLESGERGVEMTLDVDSLIRRELQAIPDTEFHWEGIGRPPGLPERDSR